MEETRRRVVLATSVVAGAAGALTTFGYGFFQLLVAQGARADERVRPHTTTAPPPRDYYGDPTDPLLTLAVLGDSSAQGVGVDDFDDTFGGWMGRQLAASGHYVRVVCVAENGTRAEHLADQVARALPARPDLAVISTGVNDVRNRTPPRRAGRQLGDAVRQLRAADVRVVVGTTPYLGILKLVDQPLRGLAQVSSLLLERCQVPAVRAAGGVAVPLGALLSPEFEADRTLFSTDGFHPSQRGYARIGELLLPALLSNA